VIREFLQFLLGAAGRAAPGGDSAPDGDSAPAS
jgi:hypothetical protein